MGLVMGIFGLATGAWLLWCTVIAFVGGHFPLIPFQTSGGIGSGLLWLFIIDPILITVLYWIAIIAFSPLMILFGITQRDDD